MPRPPPSRRTQNNQNKLTVQAQIVSEARVIQIVQKLWRRSEHSDPRKDAQREIPQGHDASQVPSGSVFHEVLATKDENRIRRNGKDGDDRVISHPFQHRNGVVFLFEPGQHKLAVKKMSSAVTKVTEDCRKNIRVEGS